MRPQALPALAAVLVVALTGCLAPPMPEPLEPASLLGDAAPRLGVDSLLPRAAQDRAGAGLDAPPRWALGTWWTYRVESLAFGRTFEVTRVVAGDEPGRYLVGMPADAFSDEVLVFHHPGFGQVDAATLGFEHHDHAFAPLRFPLAEGATWTTHWYSGDEMTATVISAADGRAEVALDHPVRATRLVYDAALGEIASMEVDGYVRYEIIAHGTGFEGEVVVPYAHDLVVCHGRVLGVQAIDDCAFDGNPRGPLENVAIHGAYDRLSFALILRNAVVPLPTAGLQSIEMTAPDGTLYAGTLAPTDPGPAFLPFGHAQPVGDWAMRAVAAGPGSVLFEGVAYRALRATLGGADPAAPAPAGATL